MAHLPAYMEEILANGKVDTPELETLRRELYADGKIDRREADWLVEMHKRIQRRGPAWEEFFYQAVKDHLLADGTIDAEETAWLRQLILADGLVDTREKKFLHELKGEAKQTSPEFEAFYAQCMK
jgi:tellurite resistance protein